VIDGDGSYEGKTYVPGIGIKREAKYYKNLMTYHAKPLLFCLFLFVDFIFPIFSGMFFGMAFATEIYYMAIPGVFLWFSLIFSSTSSEAYKLLKKR
jgi:hypothetical protein